METDDLPDIYAYTDYRKYLRDAYFEFKRTRPSGFTHRRIGQKGGFDPGLFSKVIQGKRNISPKLVPGFCRAFGLDAERERYFQLLVRYCQTGAPEEKQRLGQEMASFPGSRAPRLVPR